MYHTLPLKPLCSGFAIIVHGIFCNSFRYESIGKREQVIIDLLYCRLTNDVVMTCDLSIGLSLSVPPRLVGRCRLVVLGLLQRPELLLEPSLVPSHGMREYRARCHPANRISDELRVAISGNLDMALRADPSAAGGSVTYKLYDPEVNNYGKLQRMIYRKMNQQLGIEACGSISSSTFKRILNDYMLERDGQLSFARHDHNVCIHFQGLEIALHALELELQTMPPSCDPETRRVREAQLASAQE